MKLRKAFLGGISATILFSTGVTTMCFAEAAPRNADLATRVDSLEAKLDALIELMSKDKAQEATPSPTDNVIAAASPELQEGLILDLYLVGKADQLSELPVPQSVSPSASELVPSPTSFEWGSFTELSSMARFTGPIEKQIALNWTGKIAIPQSGNHIFAVEIIVDQSANTSGCASNLIIDDQEVLKVASSPPGGYISDARSTNEQGAIGLEQGFHNFSFWGHCVGGRPDFSKVHFNLLLKGPNDRAPKPIPTDRFATEG